jgi:hypothetical protein
MKSLLILVAVIATNLAALLAVAPSRATEYAANSNPACRIMRNVALGAPAPPEPNRDDTREATPLAGGAKTALDKEPFHQRYFARALPLLQKIDREGTAALAQLPPDTPRVDLVIDRHVSNLMWARAMLGQFYEEGRAVPVDERAAAEFYQKSIDTRFVDDRGCVHSWPPTAATRLHLAGLYAYGLGMPQDRAKARELAQPAGTLGESVAFLIDRNALPATFADYLNTDLNGVAENIRHPPVDLVSYLLGLGEGESLTWHFLRPALLAAVAVLSLFVGGVGLILSIRRKQGHADAEGSYAILFATYDLLARAFGRLGLVVGGLTEIVLGFWMLAAGASMGAFALPEGFSFAYLVAFVLAASGALSFLRGLAKLVEAARFNLAAKNSGVHGEARPASEQEALAAARGDKSTGPHDQTFAR